MNQPPHITPLIPAESLQARVRYLGRLITESYPEASRRNPLHLVVVLKGAFRFAADLMAFIERPYRIQFVTASSYGTAASSSGRVSLRHTMQVHGRHLIIIEDIIDTGLTMQRLTEECLQLGAASVRLCTLLDKPARRRHPIAITWKGFTVPDHFLVGYGLDYNEEYRDLPWIGTLTP